MGRAGLQELNALPPLQVPLPNHNLLRTLRRKKSKKCGTSLTSGKPGLYGCNPSGIHTNFVTPNYADLP
jgi:hypothetical protein